MKSLRLGWDGYLSVSAHSLLLIQSVVFTGVRWIAARTTRTGCSSEQNCHGIRQVSFIVNQRPDENQAEHMKANIKQGEPIYHHGGGNNLRRITATASPFILKTWWSYKELVQQKLSILFGWTRTSFFTWKPNIASDKNLVDLMDCTKPQ